MSHHDEDREMLSYYNPPLTAGIAPPCPDGDDICRHVLVYVFGR